jgi:hypothetical protein
VKWGIWVAAALAGACASRDPNEVIAGTWAVHGKVVYRDSKIPDGRGLSAGHALRRGATLDLDDAEVAVEGFNGFVTLVRGSPTKRVGSLRLIDGPMPPERVIKLLGTALESRKLPPAPISFRYELPPDVLAARGPQDDSAQNMAFFFLPHSANESTAPAEHPVPAELAAGPREFVHPIRVAPPKPDPSARRSLMSAKGPVVVELNDMSCAFAEDMQFPLALDRVHRIRVLEGAKATLNIDGNTADLSEDDDLIVLP